MSYASENSITSFEEVHKLLKAMQERWDHERRENESLKKELEGLKSENIRLEDELRKSRDGYLVAKRSRFAEDVYNILMERVRRGGGETSLKEIFDELRRRNHELEGEKRELESQLRVFGKKYKDFIQRLSELVKEMECT